MLSTPLTSKKFNPFRRLRRDEGGFTAVEFAMVIGPFLALLFAIIEVGLTYFVSFSFEHAVDMAARKVRVGTAQSSGINVSEFRDMICSKIPRLITCSDIIIDVRCFSNFARAAADVPSPIDGDGNLLTQQQARFELGGSSDVILVSAYYNWKLLASMPNPGATLGLGSIGFGNMPDGSRLVSAAAAFRNEPFGTGTPCS